MNESSGIPSAYDTNNASRTATGSTSSNSSGTLPTVYDTGITSQADPSSHHMNGGSGGMGGAGATGVAGGGAWPSIITCNTGGTPASYTVTSSNLCGSGITAIQQIITDLSIVYTGAEGIEINQPRSTSNRISVIDLSGIHKILPRVNGTIKCTAPVSHSLGLLLIEGVTHINIDSGGKIDTIMNKYLGTQDIISAQDELLDAGYRDHARL